MRCYQSPIVCSLVSRVRCRRVLCWPVLIQYMWFTKETPMTSRRPHSIAKQLFQHLHFAELAVLCVSCAA